VSSSRQKVRESIKQLRPYVAGKGFTEISRRYGLDPKEIVKLGSNENPYGPSPQVKEALQKISPERYPEPEELSEALASYTGLPEEMIVIGAGMDGVMETLTRIFLEAGDLTFIPTPTFSYYEILTILAGARPLFSPRGLDFQIQDTIPKDVKMAFLCSPNNPTGNVLKEDELCQLLETTDAIVFLDEAYVEFAEQSLAELVGRYDNLVVGRTLSKAFGLAGMRLGYALMPQWMAQEYRRAAPPFFATSCASAAAGVAALADLDYMHKSVDKIRMERERLQKEIKSHPSQGNFLYLKTEEASETFVERFLQRGIIIRDCRPFRGAGEHHVRVTVGTPAENEQFLAAYREIQR